MKSEGMQPPIASIREEREADFAAIRRVHEIAFGTTGEGRLVDRLRREDRLLASLVAIVDGNVVGSIIFSSLPIETHDGVIAAAVLAPMAVLPEYQRGGIGTALVSEGLQICRKRGLAAVLVRGHPEYYPRFGFSPELAADIGSNYSVPRTAWMALELVPNVLRGVAGKVTYPDPFDEVSR